ncbi:hypothetical protein NEPAR06_0993 [Nematocida parisii]|uniref:Uncharacterized protein n=1 Tax=Nematocida parisii (strain ERTm3) TaxID=935791 RepID=I3EFN5_NEMP3|nr:hypothetical protein NEQG_01476 [Nematocida parisii ERTm3]KAI5128405.1 hypothetical protein NEPAR08_1216 [Nematocida parisii]KAI5128456.1 hypothetical protein NEPAR03_1310 [Nematocida parisii]KAI5144502.1 hypothetical protein NEPAR07_1096 [Nematocida parisii]KAI5154267.1 hypothetical protein NEPAR06_0993 [Nematocida parisii]
MFKILYVEIRAALFNVLIRNITEHKKKNIHKIFLEKIELKSKGNKERITKKGQEL